MVCTLSKSLLALSLGQANQLVTDADRDVGRVEHLLPILQILPAADFILGGVTLVVIVVFHGIGMRTVTDYVRRRSKAMAARATSWRADLLLANAIFCLLSTLLLETVAWTAVLLWTRLVPSWREGGYFVANTYTTLGYGKMILPESWKMLAPIIGISGLFCFGWTGSVLVDLVGRVNRLKDLAEQVRSGATSIGPPPGPAASPDGPATG